MVTDEIVAAACEGDTDAQELVIMWLYDELASVVRTRVPDPDQEDVHHRALHDILVKMQAHAPRQVEPFRKWAIGFGYMAAQEYWGRLKRKSARTADGLDVEAFAGENSSFHSRWDKRLFLRLLSSFLRRLSRRYRSPLEHHRRDGNDSSFALRRGLAKATVRWRRHEGRKRLKVMFLDHLSGGSAQRRPILAPESSS